jgi:hypothetical protein
MDGFGDFRGPEQINIPGVVKMVRAALIEAYPEHRQLLDVNNPIFEEHIRFQSAIVPYVPQLYKIVRDVYSKEALTSEELGFAITLGLNGTNHPLAGMKITGSKIEEGGVTIDIMQDENSYKLLIVESIKFEAELIKMEEEIRGDSNKQTLPQIEAFECIISTSRDMGSNHPLQLVQSRVQFSTGYRNQLMFWPENSFSINMAISYDLPWANYEIRGSGQYSSSGHFHFERLSRSTNRYYIDKQTGHRVTVDYNHEHYTQAYQNISVWLNSSDEAAPGFIETFEISQQDASTLIVHDRYEGAIIKERTRRQSFGALTAPKIGYRDLLTFARSFDDDNSELLSISQIDDEKSTFKGRAKIAKVITNIEIKLFSPEKGCVLYIGDHDPINPVTRSEVKVVERINFPDNNLVLLTYTWNNSKRVLLLQLNSSGLIMNVIDKSPSRLISEK